MPQTNKNRPMQEAAAARDYKRSGPQHGTNNVGAVLRPWRIVAIFVAVSLTWVVGTDLLLQAVISEPILYVRLQALKGLIFVALLGAMLYFLLRSARNSQLELHASLRQHQSNLEEQVRSRTAQLYRSREQLRRLTNRMHSLSESERKSISRELHDAMGSYLTILKIDLQALKRECDPDAKTTQRLDTALGMVDTMYFNIRKLAAELRPAVIDEFGLSAGIEWLAENFRQRWSGECEVDVASYALAKNELRDTALFRICQESLTNVLKHAQADKVSIQLSGPDSGLVRLVVEDNGRGVAVGERDSGEQLGLVGMRERAINAGGQLIVEDREGGGTRVRVELPVEPAAAPKAVQA